MNHASGSPANPDIAEKRHQAFNYIQSAVSHWTAGMINTYANKTYADFYGKTPEQMLGRSVGEFIAKDYIEQRRASISSVLAGNYQSFETTLPDSNGRKRTLIVNYQPEVLGGPCSGFFVHFLDITDLLYEREKHLITNHTFESVIKNLGSASLISKTDLKGRIVYVSPKFCEISGYTEEELMGKDHRMVNSGVHPKEFFKQMWNTILAGTPWQGEVCNRTKNGGIYWVQNVITPILDLEGKPQGFISIRFDITDKKKEEKNLILSSKLATLGEVSAGIAHEINQPITILSGRLKLLEFKLINNTFDQNELPKTVSLLISMTERIASIARGLKSFSRNSENDEKRIQSINTII